MKKRRKSPKPTCFCKVSGDGKRKKKVLKKIAKLSSRYSVTVLVGGGSDINKAFIKKGYKVRFGPLGRKYRSLKERQLGRRVLEKNQAMMQDLFDTLGIAARVKIPFRVTKDVLCPENGDLSLLSHYIGFDKVVIFTEKKRVKKKKKWLKRIPKTFSHIKKGKLDKVKIIGF